MVVSPARTFSARNKTEGLMVFLRLATARAIALVLLVSAFTLAASDASAATGAQTWNFKLLGAVQVFGGIGQTFFYDGAPVGPITIPVVVAADGSFSASYDIPTFPLGPCTIQATAAIPSGTFDTAIHLTFRWSVTSIPPSGPLCTSIPLTDTVLTMQLDKPFPNAR